MYEHLVDHALAQGDRSLEAASRAMLARCLMRRRDNESAEEQLRCARAASVGAPPAVEARLRAVDVRFQAIDTHGPALANQMREYYEWGVAHDEGAAFDAAGLLAEQATGDERVDWYRRALDHGRTAGLTARLGTLCHALAATLEGEDRLAEAMDAYKSALELHEHLGDRRQVVASRWAIGALAARDEDWITAQESLQAAVDTGSQGMDCEDLLALALADLAGVHQQWGDDIEARRLLLQGLAIGREIGLAQIWPERWDSMLKHAEQLEL
ncbi:MAG: tetratricopeptide (TPR) repeat protein [Myxococcota bacterium]|jgi:tetratricopeptide (TPR) repeat protein